MSPPYRPLVCDENPFNLEEPRSGMVCATKPRHCPMDRTILRVTKDYGPQYTVPHSNVVSYSTGQRSYKLGVNIGIPKDTKLVYDGATGAPLLQLKGPSFTWLKSKFHMRAGDDPRKPIVAACKMKVGGNKVKLEAEFEDKILSGVRHKLYFTGSRWTRNFDVFLGDKRYGRKVAKLYQPNCRVQGAKHADHYHIHIAAGVDNAMIVAMLLAVEAYLGAW